MCYRALDGQLAGDDGGAAGVAVLYDLEEIGPALYGHGSEAPIVEDEQVDAGEAFEQSCGHRRGRASNSLGKR